jgi:hypothetical protein
MAIKKEEINGRKCRKIFQGCGRPGIDIQLELTT